MKKEEKKNEIVKAKKVKVEEKKEEKEQNPIISLIELLGIIAFIIVVLVFFPNTIIWNIVVLLLIITVLVFVHEGGHFLAAKWSGVYVYEFAIGMGPKILGFKRKNDPTEYTIRCLPIGGYCQMAGEEEEDDEDNKVKKDEFMCNKPKYKRLIILCAGVFNNFLIAIIFLFFIALFGGSSIQTNEISYVTENSAAANAGITVGDKIVKFNGHKVSSWDSISLVSVLKDTTKRDSYEYVIKHQDGSLETYNLTPEDYVVLNGEYIKITDENTVENIMEDNNISEDDLVTTKLIGIGSSTNIEHGFIPVIKYAFYKFGILFTSMIKILFYLITGNLSLNSLSGPVGMYSIVNQAASYGILNIIYLAAYLSINLGVVNILPFPAFDGGRVLFVIIEAITRKKVDPKVEGIIHTIGFVLIMALMVYITFQDILRLI